MMSSSTYTHPESPWIESTVELLEDGNKCRFNVTCTKCKGEWNTDVIGNDAIIHSAIELVVKAEAFRKEHQVCSEPSN